MLTFKEQAEVCRIGLIIELLTQQEVVRWADNIIGTDDHPDYAVVDISLTGNSGLPSLVSLLFEIAGDANSDKVINTVLGLCSERLNRGVFDANKSIAVLSRLVPESSCRRCSIMAEYEICIKTQTADMIRTVLDRSDSDVVNTIHAFLMPYSGYAQEITLESI